MKAALELVVRSAGHTTDSLEDEQLAIGKGLTTVALEHGIVPVTPEVGRRLLTRDAWALLDLSDPAWRGILGTALQQHGHPDPQGVIDRLDRMGGGLDPYPTATSANASSKIWCTSSSAMAMTRPSS